MIGNYGHLVSIIWHFLVRFVTSVLAFSIYTSIFWREKNHPSFLPEDMCADSIPSSNSSSIKMMKPLDAAGRIPATNVYIGGTFSADSFHSPEKMDEPLEEPLSQLPLKSDSNKSTGMKVDYQENGDLIEALPGDDLYRSGLSTYSIMLYKLGSNSSMDNCPADINPLMLQALSNILNVSSDVKRIAGSLPGNPAKLGTQSVLSSPISKPHSALLSEVESIPQGSSLLNREIPGKIPLLNITNKFPRQNLGDLIMMSPTTTIPEGQPAVSHVATHTTSQSEFLSAFIHKTTQVQSLSDHSQHMDLASSGEDSQMGSLLKTDHTRDQSLNHALGTIRVSKLSMPPLTNCRVSGHKICGGLIRETHNMKERRRRARIKNACNLMRQLVPGMSHKTDKATVFEFSARYIHFLKSFVGSNSDKDFLLKYNPY